MKKLLLGITALGLASGAAAQNLPSFDFKGIQATDSYDQHSGAFSKCDKYFNFQGCKFKDDEVAGTLAFPEAGWADDGSLVLIRGEVADWQFDQLAEGFRAKWGKPDIHTVETLQNGYGAKVEVPYSVWKFAEGEMRLSGPAFRQKGKFEFLTHERIKYMDGLNKPKADF